MPSWVWKGEFLDVSGAVLLTAVEDLPQRLQSGILVWKKDNVVIRVKTC